MKNIVLISQLSICVMVPTFLCLAIGLWLDGKFGTYFTIPLLIIGIAAGARNAYVLAMNSIKQDEQAKKASRLLVNNMCMLMAVGFVMIARLSYTKCVKQFAIAVAGTLLTLAIPWLSYGYRYER